MITEQTPENLEKLFPLAEAFFTQSESKGSFYPEHWSKSWSILIQRDIAAIFVYEEGGKPLAFLGAFVLPDLVTGEIVATESFWFAGEAAPVGAGMKLLQHFEEWAQERNAVRVRMAGLINEKSRSLTKVYGRRGYEPIEIYYEKTL